MPRALSASPPARRGLSCGIVVVAPGPELLLCHVTGQRHWDLPKGGIHADESPLDAARRETAEECGLVFDAGVLVDLGRFVYTARKDLHLFAAASARAPVESLVCASTFVERGSGRRRPEMDGFGWFAPSQAGSHCTATMAALLGGLDWSAIGAALAVRGTVEPLAA